MKKNNVGLNLMDDAAIERRQKLLDAKKEREAGRWSDQEKELRRELHKLFKEG